MDTSISSTDNIKINMEPNDRNEQLIKILVCPTTGGQFQIEMDPNDSVDNFRRKIARHLQMPRERLKVIFQQK